MAHARNLASDHPVLARRNKSNSEGAQKPSPRQDPEDLIQHARHKTCKELVNFVQDCSEDCQQHYQIYEAISAGDLDAAAEAMRRHLLTALDLTRSEAFLK